MAFEPASRGADLDPRMAGVGGVPRVHIDIGVPVHGIAIPMCAPPIPHVAGGVAVAPRPPDRRCRSGGCGRGGSDPPFGMPGTASGKVACARPCHLPRRGRSRIRYPCRKAVQRRCGAADRQFYRPSSRCVCATAEDRARTRGERQTVGCRERRGMSRRFGSPETLGCGKVPVREFRARSLPRS